MCLLLREFPVVAGKTLAFYMAEQGINEPESLTFMTVNNKNLEYTLKVYTFVKNSTMKNLSLKLEDDIFQETEKIVTKVNKNRNRYINEAIDFYNQLHKRRLLSKQLSKESKLVSRDSLEILAEFEKLHDKN